LAQGFIEYFSDQWLEADSELIRIFYRCTQCGIISRGEVHRDPDSKCPTCQYDLTGNQSGICPECGQQIPEFILRNLK